MRGLGPGEDDLNAPTSDPKATDRVLLLGESERRYGEFRLASLPSGKVACALSVGADRSSPALGHKGHEDEPNEDALLAVETGSRTLLAVADAHYGAFASHAMLRRLDDVVAEAPFSPALLLRALRATVSDEDEDEGGGASETTLLAAVYRRDHRAGFGVSFGDSSCVLVGKEIGARRLGAPTGSYVKPTDPRTLALGRASFFEFEAPPGSLLLAFTDGIDGCHYRHPETSLGPRQFLEVLEETGPHAEPYARRLAQWALEGCDGHPGGQDNFAVVVVET